MPHAETRAAEQARIVFLVNFVSPNLLEVLREVQLRVGSLHILASVPVEANRQWQPDIGDLTVIRQRTWTCRRTVKHPGGYEEELFVHLPLDTLSQLRRLRPDCVVSLEMGARSLLASFYRRLRGRDCRHVLAVYGSQRSEEGRGAARRWLRRRLVRAADIVTYNGPSCRRYLLAQAADPDRLRPWNYAADPQKIYRGPIEPFAGGDLKLLTVGQLIPRKGIARAAHSLSDWVARRPERNIEWAIAGVGPEERVLESMPRAANLHIRLLGHRDTRQLQELYRDYPVLLFPTLGDEWGLVVDEALASGQLVIGSVQSQAVETLVQPEKNGWWFDPDQPRSLAVALDRLLQLEPAELSARRALARQSVIDRTPVQSAEQFVAAVSAALAVNEARKARQWDRRHS